MNNEEAKYDPPQKSAGDVVHAVVRAGLGAIPVAAAAATELLNAIVAPPLEKRRNKWMKEIGMALRELEEKMGIVLESLQDNEEFIDVALEATQIAIKTSNQEKKEALKNAILNSALPNPPEESLQKMFLSFIDTLTVWHLKLLELFNDPPAYIENHEINFTGFSMGAPSHLVENAFPELRGKRDLYDLIWKDLYSRALVTTEGLHVMMTGSGIIAKRTTEIGKLFLDYIKNPLKTAP
ncbi:MAG: hypothetical protein FJ241_09575 [Nitrospira sp.]|nr:hypothetical protein [Nitrospira sp.]